MITHTLVINCGSSSLKFALIDAASTALLNQALIEQLTAEPLAEVQSLLPR